MDSIIQVSDQGRTFKGEVLDENTLKSRELVSYENKLYVTGNRKNRLVELYGIIDMELERIVLCESIRIVKNRLK